MRRNGGIGSGPRPITHEQKGWKAEILKPLYLALGFGALLNLFWCAFYALQWLDDPHSEWIRGYKDDPGAWLKVIVIQWMVALGYLFLKWTETFWDDDYTTLVGQHPMLGILPMRPLFRVFLFASWLRGLWADRPKKENVDIEFKAKFGGDDE
jgi:hypothetical protein